MVRICLVLLALTGLARADLPGGHWTGVKNGVEMRLEIDGRKLELAFQGPGDRQPVRVDGDDRATWIKEAMKTEGFRVELQVTRVVQKQLTGKSWNDRDLPSTKQLGRAIRAGDSLKLELFFGCDAGHSTVQLCLLDKKVECRALADPSRACKMAPAPARSTGDSRTR